ncbi:MAG: KpsF/GutQ family sugar-phosphate isomerase [Candidatus Omnitrophica bacterium]|nr:KpsF/GutQ family sugar-phosphate isomerase [Candidatus Omnitrophota bacterium]
MTQEIKIARRVLRIEAEAVRALGKKIGASFKEAVRLMKDCPGRVIVTGMGKPGFIGRKIAATLASMGTPSLFLHPADAIHGDLGMVTKEDVVIAISNSGETEEITKLLSTIKRIGAKLIAMTGNLRSTLAQYADVVLDVGIRKEACPLGLAPTASTTATLAMGDALAVALGRKKNFKEEDFALYHPGGSLGRKLLRVRDLMRKGNSNPAVKENTAVRNALLKITSARAGSCSVVDSRGRLVGIFTDGDLRRHIENGTENILEKRIIDVATRRPRVIRADKLAAEAISILRDKKIDEVPVVDEKGRLVGLLDIQDLLRAGFV